MSREPDQPRRPSGDYAVGYCRPPKEHQFRPGESGNPRGRPEGALTLEDLFAREARRLVKLKRGDEIIHITKLEALVRKVFQKGLDGDLGASRIILQLATQGGEVADQNDPDTAAMPDDEAVQRILRRFQHLVPDRDNDE